MDVDDEAAQMRYAQALGRLGRGRRLRGRDGLGHLLHGRARRAVRPGAVPRLVRTLSRRRAEAAGAGGAAARARRGAAARRAGQLSWTCRASAGWRSGWPTRKTVLFVSHDRELLARTATRIVTVERGPGGSGRLGARRRLRDVPRGAARRFARLEELRRRWDEEHAQLRALVLMLQAEGRISHGMASPLPGRCRPGCGSSRRRGRRRSRRASRTSHAAARRAHRQAGRDVRRARAHRPDAARSTWRCVTASGSRCSVRTAPASRTSCGCSRRGQRPDVEHRPPPRSSPWRTPERLGWAPGSGPAGSRRPTRTPSCSGAPWWTSCTGARRPRRAAARARCPGAGPLRAGRGGRDQRFEKLSGGQQARFQILLLELSGATLLLLDEPTDNLDLRVRGGAAGGPGAVRGHGTGRHPRSLVRARVRPVPGVRSGRAGVRVRHAGLGRGPGRPRAVTLRLSGAVQQQFGPLRLGYRLRHAGSPVRARAPARLVRSDGPLPHRPVITASTGSDCRPATSLRGVAGTRARTPAPTRRSSTGPVTGTKPRIGAGAERAAAAGSRVRGRHAQRHPGAA